MKLFALTLLPALALSTSNWFTTEAPLVTDTQHGAEPSQSHYHSPGKPGSAIAHLQQDRFQVEPSGEQSITLQLASSIHEGQLLVQIKAGGGIDISGVDETILLDLSAANLRAIELSISPLEVGAHHLNLVLTHLVDGQPQAARALAAEVQVGAPQVQALYAKSEAIAAPTMIALPAQEKIY